MRTLSIEFNSNKEIINLLIPLVSMLGSMLYVKQNINNINIKREYKEFYIPKIKTWNNLVTNIKNILEDYKLVDKNWKKPNMESNIWERYIECFDNLKVNISNEYSKFMSG